MTAKCDECGKPYVNGDMLYSVASKFDDDGNLTSFRHWQCHTPLDVALNNLRSKLDNAQRALGDFDKLDRPEFTRKRTDY